MMTTRFQNIAVLIDAENASASKIDFILNQIMQLGEIRLKHVYGDFKQGNLGVWDNLSLKYIFKQIHTPALVKGKNSSDIALVIDAMDLLFHGNQFGEFDCFCIVSSDSDFSGLAKYIRHKNKAVIGFGKENTVNSFKMACDKFFVIESNNTSKVENKSAPAKNKKPTAKKTLPADDILIATMKQCIRKSLTHNGWAHYAQVSNSLKQEFPHLTPANYGYTRWLDLMQDSTFFKIKRDGLVVFVCEAEFCPDTVRINPVAHLNVDKLLDDIAMIIAENPMRVDNWVHIGYLGSQLRQLGYNPKDYGFKTSTAFLEDISGLSVKRENGGIYFTLFDDSKIPLLPEKNEDIGQESIDFQASDTMSETPQNHVESTPEKTEMTPKVLQQLSFDDLFAENDFVESENYEIIEPIQTSEEIISETITESIYSDDVSEHHTDNITENISENPSTDFQPDIYDDLKQAISTIFNAQATNPEDSWLKFSYLTHHLSRQGFKAKDYSCKNMLELIQKIDGLSYKEEDEILWIRMAS